MHQGGYFDREVSVFAFSTIPSIIIRVKLETILLLSLQLLHTKYFVLQSFLPTSKCRVPR